MYQQLLIRFFDAHPPESGFYMADFPFLSGQEVGKE
jgi:hypothetical protein